jgi:ankyrin repeat protein
MYLLRHPEVENINRPDKSGQTPLMIAAAKRYWRLCKMLLSMDVCSVSIGNHEKNTVLHILVKRTPMDFEELVIYREVLDLVLQHRGVDINAANIFGETPLHFACVNNSLEGVHFLVKNGAKLSVRNKSVLFALLLLFWEVLI